jgi:hypothetical protein
VVDPYPQEINDIPAIVARQPPLRRSPMIIVYEEMVAQSARQPLVMGIALHPYLVGQPHRLRHLRRALRHIVQSGRAWWCTPGAILDHVEPILAAAREHVAARDAPHASRVPAGL